jgi:hypothetical protein
LDEITKTEAKKIPSCPKAKSTEYRTTFCISAPAMVISAYERKILEMDIT